MRFAYADPPYPGCSYLYPEKTEVDHQMLLANLITDYPDGWALSTSSVALGEVLAHCPLSVRVGAWVKPFAVFKPNVGVAYAWEPVVFNGGRKRSRAQHTVPDWVSANITLRRGLVGAKPEKFCHWILDVLNVGQDDTVDDLYPGTGVLSRVLDARRRQRVLAL